MRWTFFSQNKVKILDSRILSNMPKVSPCTKGHPFVPPCPFLLSPFYPMPWEADRTGTASWGSPSPGFSRIRSVTNNDKRSEKWRAVKEEYQSPYPIMKSRVAWPLSTKGPSSSHTAVSLWILGTAPHLALTGLEVAMCPLPPVSSPG